MRFDQRALNYWSRLREIPNPSDRYLGTARVLPSRACIRPMPAPKGPPYARSANERSTIARMYYSFLTAGTRRTDGANSGISNALPAPRDDFAADHMCPRVEPDQLTIMDDRRAMATWRDKHANSTRDRSTRRDRGNDHPIARLVDSGE